MVASIPQQQQQQTHERYIPPPLKILPEHQEQLQQQQQHSDLQHQQQYSGTNLRNYHANVFTTPGTATTATATAGAFREPQHVGDVVAAATATATSTNGIFENGKVGPIQFHCVCYFYSFHNHHAYQLPKT